MLKSWPYKIKSLRNFIDESSLSLGLTSVFIGPIFAPENLNCSSIDFFRNSTAEANCCVDSVLESSCTNAYTAVLRSESPCTSLSAASFERSLIEEAMFISDLHLQPNQSKITAKFLSFCDWAKGKTRSLYILGDFLHAWPGDDAIDEWSIKIIDALANLVDSGVKVYFMPGNRDFLIGKKFLNKAKLQELLEPEIIYINNKKVLLVHGDGYCTNDKSHQWFRRFTRNRLFKLFFLCIPYKYRYKLVNKVRQYSANNTKITKNMLTVPEAIAKQLRTFKVDTVIHGHTHIAGLTKYSDKYGDFLQYVLSDWDESPLILCYNSTSGFYYRLFVGGDCE